MAIEFKGDFAVIDDFRRRVRRVEREWRKQVAQAIKAPLKEAVKYGRSLLRALFSGRGRRYQRAFVQQVRLKSDDLEARLGYIQPPGKGGSRKFWWLGRVYEYGGRIRVRGGKRSGKPVWIPVGDNRSGSGAAVISPGQFFTEFQGRSVVKMSSRGNLVAFRNDGAGLVPMFVLKASVAVKARPAVSPTAKKFSPIIHKAAGTKLFDNFRR